MVACKVIQSRLMSSGAMNFTTLVSLMSEDFPAGTSNVTTATIATMHTGVGYHLGDFPTAAGSDYLGFVDPDSPISITSKGISMMTTVKMVTTPSGTGYTILGVIRSSLGLPRFHEPGIAHIYHFHGRHIDDHNCEDTDQVSARNICSH